MGRRSGGGTGGDAEQVILANAGSPRNAPGRGAAGCGGSLSLREASRACDRPYAWKSGECGIQLTRRRRVQQAQSSAGRRRQWCVRHAFHALGLPWRSAGKPGVLRYGLSRSIRAGSLRREPWDRRLDAEWLFLEARRAYLHAAWEAHPDRGGALERMQEINAAWAWLRRHLACVAARQHERALRECAAGSGTFPGLIRVCT